jgi:hypothetical protein
MTTEPRSFAALFADIVRDIQQILRGEIRLARAEAAVELARLRSGVVLLVAAMVFAVLGLAYVLLASVLLMALTLPMWMSALIVGVVVIAIAAAAAVAGLAEVRKIRGAPRTVQSLKETVRWTTT